MRRVGIWLISLVCIALTAAPLLAQDGLNLPSELYVLLNEGIVQRYGLGATGVQTIIGDENTYVLDFAVSPDGMWIAYRTQDALRLHDMYGQQRAIPPTEDITLETVTSSYPEIRGNGDTISWSPDSNWLVYATFGNLRVHNRATGAFQDLGVNSIRDLRWSAGGRYLAAGAAGNIWWFYTPAGNTLQLVSAITEVTGIAWLPDERVYITPTSGGVNILDIGAASRQTPVLPADTVYYLPIVTDPYLYVFTGTPQSAQLLSVTTEETLTVGRAPFDISNARWSPDGRSMIAFSGGTMALIDPTNGEGFTLPINGASTYGWGTYNPGDQTLTGWGASYIRADALSTGVTQVWRVPDDGTLPETITPARDSITEFTVSADGRRVAYVSNKTLYYFVVGGGAESLFDLTSISVPQAQPAFNSDATRLYFVNKTSAGGGLYFADLTTGQTFPFFTSDTETYTHPQPAPALNALLFEDGTGSTRLLDASTGEEIGVATPGRGQWLQGSLYGVIADDLTLIDASAPDQVVQTITVPRTTTILDIGLLDRQTVRMLTQTQSPAPVRVTDMRAGEVVATKLLGYFDTPRLSPDLQFVLGRTTPNGQLIVASIVSSAHRLIQTGVAVQSFEW